MTTTPSPDTGQGLATLDTDHGRAVALAALTDEVRANVAASKAANTARAYRADWQHFTAWADRHGCPTLPATPEVLACYLTGLAHDGARPSTVERRRAAIGFAHRAAGHDDPGRSELVRATVAGIRRRLGTAPHRKAPATTAVLRAMLGTLDRTTLAGKRDAALLLVGFGAALRRSELVALEVPDVAVEARGVRVTVRRSKTDQEGEGTELGIPRGSDPATCAARALAEWLAVAELTAGPLFRRVTRTGTVGALAVPDADVARLVKRCAERAGLDPADYAGHSLRAGLVTAAAEAGADAVTIARQSRHRSMTVLAGYIRRATVYDLNAAGMVGL